MAHGVDIFMDGLQVRATVSVKWMETDDQMIVSCRAMENEKMALKRRRRLTDSEL